MSKKSFIVTLEYNGDLEPEYEKQVADLVAEYVWHGVERNGITPDGSTAYAEGVVVEPDTKLVELVKDISSNVAADIFFDAEKNNEPGLQSEIDALFENINELRKLFGLNPIQ